jgi:hypothetical protein
MPIPGVGWNQGKWLDNEGGAYVGYSVRGRGLLQTTILEKRT